MPDANDMDLLGDYARHGSEIAFAELVQRHLGLVYSVALRQRIDHSTTAATPRTGDIHAIAT